MPADPDRQDLPLPWRTRWPLVVVTVRATSPDELTEFFFRLGGVAYPLERVLVRVRSEPGSIAWVRDVAGRWRGGVEVLRRGGVAWDNEIARWQRARPSTVTVAWEAEPGDRYSADAFRRIAAGRLRAGVRGEVGIDRRQVPSTVASDLAALRSELRLVAGDVRISVAVMFHPKRRDIARRLAEACAPLPVDLVPDPDPTGRPNALRTARRAWAAIPDWATHHIVLQDDVVPVEDFAAAVRAAITDAPTATIALYSNANSRNGAMARNAAVRGAAWAALLADEYTPTLGVVMPRERALGYLEFLETVPASASSDDDILTDYLRLAGGLKLQAVPNLVEHSDGPSVVGTLGFHQGKRRSACFTGDAARRTAPSPLAEVFPAGGDPLVVLQAGHAQVLLPDRSAPKDYGTERSFHWPEACAVFQDGLASRLKDALAGHLARSPLPSLPAARLPASLVREAAEQVWAACFLVGYTAARSAMPRPVKSPPDPVLSRRMVESLLGSGLPPSMPLAAPGEVGWFTDLGTAAIGAGVAAAGCRVEFSQEES
ncbi:hypothetical protein [Saccharopolyspora sp. NPDC050642]|uniref:hypothetical protein n=1 Tax=Saccharopolyspora sp. NPDC050642 TaxID=3157099 RepID=UPI0033D708CE